MANLKIAFLGKEDTVSKEHELICYLDKVNRIYIELDMKVAEYLPLLARVSPHTPITLMTVKQPPKTS